CDEISAAESKEVVGLARFDAAIQKAESELSAPTFGQRSGEAQVVGHRSEIELEGAASIPKERRGVECAHRSIAGRKDSSTLQSNGSHAAVPIQRAAAPDRNGRDQRTIDLQRPAADRRRAGVGTGPC